MSRYVGAARRGRRVARVGQNSTHDDHSRQRTTMARTNDSSGKGHAKVKQGTSGGPGGKGKTGSPKSQHAKKDNASNGSTGSKSSGGSGSSEGSGGGHGGTHG